MVYEEVHGFFNHTQAKKRTTLTYVDYEWSHFEEVQVLIVIVIWNFFG